LTRLLASVDTWLLLVLALLAALVVAAVAHRTPLARRRAGVPVLAAVVAVGALGAGYHVRGSARDVHEDQREAAARLPTGPTTMPDGPSRRAVVWAVGDGPDGRAGSRAVGRLVTADDPDRILYLGDVYDRYGPALRRTFGADVSRVAPTPGNHDWPADAAAYQAFWRRTIGQASTYYSFRTGGWTVLSLNSEVPHGEGSEQLRWLRRQAQAPGDCTIAFVHRGRYSAGRHGDQRDMAPVWDALTGRAALILAGHDHDMQRLVPRSGTTSMVVGSGGHSHYDLRPDARVAFGDDTHDGALRLLLRPGRLSYEFVAVGGAVLDRGTLTCGRTDPGRTAVG
jgi:hypothetical protein